MKLFAILLALLLPAIAWGQAPQCCPTGQCPTPTQGWRSPQRPQQPRQVGNPAIVRVGCQYGRMTDYGTGTIIRQQDKSAYILTCWHTFRDSGGKGRPFVWAGGREYNAILLHTDKLWDVAVLKIVDPKIKPLPLSNATPTRGQQIWLAGFGSGQYRHATGSLTGFAAPARVGGAAELMTVSTGTRQGDSGGPMIGVRGGVVGIISTTTGRSTYGCCLPRLRRILRAVLPPYLPPPRQVIVMPDKPPPAPPISPTPPVAPANAALLERIAALESQVKALQKQVAACVAKEGPQGPIGRDGPRGPPGAAAVIDYPAITSQLPPVIMQIEHPDGKVFEQSKPLGQPIRIKLVPRAQPKQ